MGFKQGVVIEIFKGWLNSALKINAGKRKNVECKIKVGDRVWVKPKKK